MVSANPHDPEIVRSETCSQLQEKPGLKFLKNKPTLHWRKYTTPDFKPMNDIVFWNSMGFFFFGFIIRFATAQLLDVSGTGMGLVFSSQTIGGLISAPIVGYFTDKISKKRLVLLGSFGRALSYVVLYLGTCLLNVYLFSIGTFLLGFSVGFFWTPLNALISQKTYKTIRSTAFGQQAGAIGKGNLVGSIFTIIYFGLTTLLVPDNPWIVYFPLIIFCGFNVYAGIIFERQVDETTNFETYINTQDEPYAKMLQEEIAVENLALQKQKTEEEKNKKNSGLKSLPLGLTFGFLILMGAFFTAAVNQSLAGPFLQAFLTDEFFNSSAELSVAFLVMLIYFPSEVISQLLAPKFGKLGDRINPTVALSFISATGALITYGLINSNSAIMFGVILLFDTTFAWANGLVLQNLMSRLSKSNRGKIFGTRQWVTLLGAVIGPILGGIVWDQLGPRSPFTISIFIELSLIPLYLIAIKLLKPHMAEKV